MGPRSLTLRVLNTLDSAWGRLRLGLRGQLGYGRPILVEPYLGYGNGEVVRLMGRVMVDPRLLHPEAPAGRLRNLHQMSRRALSEKVEGARLELRFGSGVEEATSDEEGYFTIEASPPRGARVEGKLWQRARLRLVSPRGRGQGEVLMDALYQQPAPGAPLGIISDVDDTILRTGATAFLRQARTVLFNGPGQRLPLPGVGAFYRGLQGDGEGPGRPIFYVSSSPWNLYSLFLSFLDLNHIPRGALFLKNFGLGDDHFIKASHEDHKVTIIQQIFDDFPKMGFILLGDSGQADAEIYRLVAERNPGRVRVVYIRDVGLERGRARVNQEAERTRALGVETLLIPDTLAAARHALGLGLIRPEDVLAVAHEMEIEEAKMPNLADLAEAAGAALVVEEGG